MTYQRQTISLSSVAPDLIPQDAPAEAWNTCRNIFFRNGESTRIAGDTLTLPGAQADARTMLFVRTAQGTPYWVYATATGIYCHDGTDEFDITPAGWGTGSAQEVFTSCALSGLAYINASERDPVYWDLDPQTPCQPLPDWPTDGRCYALRAHKSFLFAIGFYSEGQQRVRWSDAAEPGVPPSTWTPAPDNLAGFLDLAPLSSPTIDGATLRDSFLIYKNESIWQLDFVGGQFVFNARILFHEYGLAAPNALTPGIDDVHLFIGAEGDIFLTDGVQVQSILDGRAQRTFYADFQLQPTGIFAAATLAREKLGVIAWPQAGSDRATLAVIYDFTSGDIGFRDMPEILAMAAGSELQDVGDLNTWDGDGEPWADDDTVWSQEIFGASVDDVLISGAFGFAAISNPSEFDVNGNPIVAQIEKEGLSFGNGQTRKVIGRVWPKMRGREGDVVTFRLGGQEVTGGPISLGDPLPFVIGSGEPLEDFVSGRFLYIQATSQGGRRWQLGSIDVEYQEQGKW